MKTSLPSYLEKQVYPYKLQKARHRSQFAPDPVDWIERHFFIPETNAPIVLMDYQRHVIREALRRDERGMFVYNTVLYSDIKKSAKSTIAGAVALYLAWHTPWESVRIIGNDLKQADSRTFYYIERALRLNEALGKQCDIKLHNIRLPNSTLIQAIPVDPDGEAGGGDLFTCWTELWAAKNKAAQRLWTEATLSPLKYGRSMRWCESYAGFVGESPILEQLYETGVKGGERIHDDLELYRNGSLLALWNTQPRCDWQTSEYYASEATTLTPSEYSRVHENAWSSSSAAFVPGEWWDACRADVPSIDKREMLVLAMDAGVTSDCFALVGVTRAGDTVTVRYANAWKPTGGALDFGLPEAELRRLIQQYNVICVVYDPFQLHDMATRVRQSEGAWVEPFGQGEPRLKADKQLYDMIRERRIVHNGDATLTEHVKNANAKTEGDKLRLVKRAEHLKIDCAVALSMATAQIMKLLV